MNGSYPQFLSSERKGCLIISKLLDSTKGTYIKGRPEKKKVRKAYL